MMEEDIPHANIPIIDLDAANAATSLLEAATTYGFVYIKQESSGLDATELDETFRLV